MTKVEALRAGTNGSNGKGLLFITLGSTHVEYIKSWLLRDKAIAFYYFARVFERSHLHGESGLHKHIMEIQIGQEVELTHFSKAKGHPTSAFLDFPLEHYERLRRTGKRGKTPFPSFEKVAG